MFDLEREHHRKTYQVCRLGFAILSASLGVACFTSIVPIFANFHPELSLRILRSEWFQWLDIPIAWGCLLGTTLLWGRWEHSGWQRRVGLLLVMGLVDIGLGLLEHGTAFGLRAMPIGHDWFRSNLGEALGWAEFALLASLSCDYLDHLGVAEAQDSGKSTRAMAATGAVLWMLLFCIRTDWSAHWPLQHRPIRTIEEVLLIHGAHLIWTITLMQVTALTISAVRQSGYVLDEMEREDVSSDPLRTRLRFHGRHRRLLVRPPILALMIPRMGRLSELTFNQPDPSTRRSPRGSKSPGVVGTGATAGSNSRSDLGSGKCTFSSRTVSSRISAPKWL